MITKKGVAKIMDFGLAKMSAASMLTKAGTTLGTIAYMSPEQSQGEKVDHRADIWSLGVVLYEMISGQLPFKGDYESAIVYSIMNEPPEPLTAARTGVPMKLEEIVTKLLAKDPGGRYQHLDELPVDLKAVDLTVSRMSKITTSQVSSTSKKRFLFWRRVFPWIYAVLITIIAAIWYIEVQRPIPSLVKRWNISLPESAPIAPIGSATRRIGRPALALSPDGKNLVYVADIGGEAQLYLRPIDKFDATPIPGTEGAYNPFFSPDGQWIGFFTGNELKKVSISAGISVTLCQVFSPAGASWGTDDRIIFSQNEGTTLSWISAVGGISQILAKDDPEYNWPEVLPDGKTALVSDLYRNIRVISLNTGEEKVLSIRGACPKYVSTGHIIYTSGGILMAVPFDIDNLEVNDIPEPILNNVRIESKFDASQYSISNNGTMIYISGGYEGNGKLVWLDRTGNIEELHFPIKTYGDFQLSPEGQRLAIEIFQNGKWNVWIYDLADPSHSFKLTLEGSNVWPRWSPDGKYVAFSSDRHGQYNVFIKTVDGSEQGILNLKSEIQQFPYSWSPNGKLLAVDDWGTHLWNISLISIDGETKGQTFVNTRYSEWGAAFSPDGNWIAYASDEQGQDNIYVKPYPKTEERWQISTEGGAKPIWSPVGNELFFRNGRKWMVVAYTTTPTFTPEVPQLLFEGDYIDVVGRSYDVLPDGQRFLLLKGSQEPKTYYHLNVVENWFEEIKEKFATRK
jgi:serine/threonine-protein kinase